MKLRREEAGLGSEEPISIPTMLKDISEAYPEVRIEKGALDYILTKPKCRFISGLFCTLNRFCIVSFFTG